MLDFVDFDEKYLIRPADNNPVLRKTVQEIVEDVKKRGDAALYDYASRFDGGVDSLFVRFLTISKPLLIMRWRT